MWTHYFQPWVYPLLLLLYAATIISCIAVVLSERRSPIKSLAWVITLIFLPVVGLIIYLFFGRSLKNLHMISKRNKRKLLRLQHETTHTFPASSLDPLSRSLVRLAHSLGATPLSYATSMEVFTDGSSKFEALKRDLLYARKFIYLQYYIFSNDSLGQEIAQILMQKAREGVKVGVIYDHVGSFSAPGRFFTRMKKAGVEAHPFFRVTFPQFANRINWRNHRKVVIIDDSIGYVGGMNIARRYVEGMKPGQKWRDTHLRLTGPVVAGLLYSFAVDWNFLKQHTQFKPISAIPVPPENSVRIASQFITSGPTDPWPAISHLFHRAILMAHKCVYIQTPYFLPTDPLLKALETAALAHVDVRVMIPAIPDSVMLRYASYSYLTECLRAGIKVYLYEPGMLHAKTMIVDDEFCTIGSTNFDFRSFEHNFEGNLLIYNKEMNSLLKRQFIDDEKECLHLTLANWLTRPAPIRLAESLMRLLSPIL